MLPEDKRSNAVPAMNLPEAQPPGRSQKATETVQSDNQDGPERFARWFPLLQKIRRSNSDQVDPVVIPQAPPHKIQQSEDSDWMPRVPDKVFVNNPVPYHDYPAVQLKNGILTPQLSRPPRNLSRLQTRLLQPRHDSDWTLAGWQKYRASHFRQGRDLTRVAMRQLFKAFPERPGYRKAYYERWYDFPEYAPFAQGLEQPCPGFAQGFAFEAYKMDIEYVGAAICYASGGRSLTLPHMAGEFAKGDLEAEEGTDARHGAALVYMRNATLLHARIRKDPEDVAAIMTFISDGLVIRFYAHYESRSPDGRVEYHQYPVLAANLAASYDEFLRGVAMLRNCQEVAFLFANETKNRLERYHAVNGINAWAYHLDDGEHILSESEDSVIEGVGGQKDGIREDQAQQEEKCTTQSIDGDAIDSGNKPKDTAHGNEEGDKSGAGDTPKEKKEEDAKSPAPHQAQQPTRVLRPRKPAAQQEEKPTPKPRKRKAGGDAGKTAPRRRLRQKC